MNRRQYTNTAIRNSLKDSQVTHCVTKQDRIKKFLGNELNKLGNVSYSQQKITERLENMMNTPNNKVYFMRRRKKCVA